MYCDRLGGNVRLTSPPWGLIPAYREARGRNPPAGATRLTVSRPFPSPPRPLLASIAIILEERIQQEVTSLASHQVHT